MHPPDDTKLWYWIGEIDEHFKYIEEYFRYWKDIINCNDLSSFEVKKQMIRNFLFDLKRQYVTSIESKVALQELSPSKIELFKQEVSEYWKKSSHFLFLFEEYGILKTVLNDKDLFKYGYDNLEPGLKTAFVEETFQQKYFRSNKGEHVGIENENALWGNVNKTKEPKTYSTIIEGFNESLKLLSEKGMNPNLIIMNSNLFFKSELIENRHKFHFNPKGNEDFNHRAEYDSINVAMSVSRYSSNKVIVCDAKKAFELRLYENEDWIDRRLFVDVELLTDDKIRDIFDKESEMWKDDGNGIKLTDEEAVVRLKNAVIIKIYQKAKFTILDSDAFEIFTVPRR